MKKALFSAFMQAFLFVTISFVGFTTTDGYAQQLNASKYVFEENAAGILSPKGINGKQVQHVGTLKTDYYKSLPGVSPQYSRFILRNLNMRNGLTDSVYDVKVSDQFRFDVEGGRTSIEKLSNSATYIIDVTNAKKHSITLIPRPATQNELAGAATTVTVVSILVAIIALCTL